MALPPLARRFGGCLGPYLQSSLCSWGHINIGKCAKQYQSGLDMASSFRVFGIAGQQEVMRDFPGLPSASGRQLLRYMLSRPRAMC